MITKEQRAELAASEPFRELMNHAGWLQLKETARADLLRAWESLRTCKPDDLPYTQGLIDGMNHVLEFADARVQSADEVLRQIRADQAAATEQALTRAAAQRERLHRQPRVGSDLG